MRIAFFDCFGGASGDMVLASCLGAGLDAAWLEQALAGLGLDGYRIGVQSVREGGFAALRLDVACDASVPQPHRHLKDILELLGRGALSDRVRAQAGAVFSRLAAAEAAVHGTTPQNVHFHEVGAVDAIVDIVGVCLALEALGVYKVLSSPVPPGSGTVSCAHGVLPVPAPATAELLKGVPLASCEEAGELTTPTGAALLTALAAGFGPMPAMTVERIGVGAGRRQGRSRANILRLFVGEAAEGTVGGAGDEVLVLQANLDDATGEVIGHVCEKLFEAGAVDVFTTPIYMKKGRPAVEITVLAPPDLRAAMEDVLFGETTTFGVRGWRVSRSTLERTVETVRTEAGEIRMKVGRRAGRVVRVSPEYEDCRRAAGRSGRPLIEVMELARRAWGRTSEAS